MYTGIVYIGTSIFVSAVDMSSGTGGMAVCFVALRADVLHIHGFMTVPCVVSR